VDNKGLNPQTGIDRQATTSGSKGNPPMENQAKAGFRRSIGNAALGTGAVTLATVVCLWLQVRSTIPTLLYLLAVVLVALGGSFLAAALVSGAAVICLQYFFLSPPWSLRMAGVDALAGFVFLATALTITRLMTARLGAESALMEQAELLAVSHDMIFARRLDGDVITYWNRAAEEAYGWTRDEATGSVPHDLLRTVFPVPLESIMAEVTSAGRWEGQLVHTRRDGTELVVDSRWSLQRDGRGRPLAILETNSDVTERKRAEGALQRAQEDLAHATRVATVGELAASLAHELNQSLAAVATNASATLRWLDRDPPDGEEAAAAARRIIRDANRASDVIAQTRALLKKSPAQRAPLDLSAVVREVLALVRPELARHRVVLQEILADGLPVVSGVRVQLQQVALNLIMNGVEAMAGLPVRGRKLVVRAERQALDGGAGVAVAVQDAGPGIAEESRDLLFQPFYTTKSHGLGLGLSISRSIVEAHGGRLFVTANGGPGATFRFVLPAQDHPGR
jgi:two-component system sensor kinase FixL